MKKFFSLNSLKSNFIIILLLLLIYVLMFGLTYQLSIEYFNLKALLISLAVWFISSIIDKEKYFNIGTFISVILFGYICWSYFFIFI